MKNSEYWKLRFAQLEEAQNNKAKIAFSEIEQQYKQAQKHLEEQIAVWYQRLADNNGITFAEARQFLKTSDLKEFRWDVEEYIKYGKENALNQRWVKQLENASAKFHISKLEAIKIHTRQSLEVMFQKQYVTRLSAYQNTCSDSYYHTAYELQKGFNIGWDIAGLNQSQIEKIISKPWSADGYNFSERIWYNKNKLINEVHTVLTQSMLTEFNPQKAIDTLAKKMKTSKNRAGAIIITESAFFSSLSEKECFDNLGVEQYEILATLDSRTSEICQNLDGKVFDMKDFQPGVTAPPFHVNCRSTTVPYFDDDFGNIGERAARDKDGKTYYVPADMTYKDWKKAFVDGDKSGLTMGMENGILEEKIAKGEITLTINPEKQVAHMEQTKTPGKSYFTISMDELQKIIDDKHGTGEIILYKNGQIKEIITLDKIIGVAKSEASGEMPTNKIKIHYSKKRTHAVPMRGE